MRKTVFDRLFHGVLSYDDYFILKKDVVGTIGFSGYHKCTATLRMLAHGMAADSWDEYLRMSERTFGDAMVSFATVVVGVFRPRYLREPTVADTERLLAISEARGWPGLLGSLDCMHWKWENCPKALQGQYRGHVKKPTIILEAVAPQDLWIWHAFFGMPGSPSGINVLQRSPLFARLTEGKAHPYQTVNGHEYNMSYYLVDVVRGPAKQWDLYTLWEVMKCCVIMHNIIVEDEGDDAAAALEFENMGDPIQLLDQNRATFEEFIRMHQQIQHRPTHKRLKEDLIEHQ
ncbi:uncharacterized protein [Aegilops tauschii subsp. strangulata]|uniref:uncharacterized protein n=1 Tax=Aegilops tauschii subsp. strangulata TaxID=200361 RepID=UPI00098A563B